MLKYQDSAIVNKKERSNNCSLGPIRIACSLQSVLVNMCSNEQSISFNKVPEQALTQVN